MIPDDLLKSLLELTKQKTLEESILHLVDEYIEMKLKYWKMVDANFQKEKGMSFQEYESTMYEEWDGIDYSHTEKFHNWEDAIASIEYWNSQKEKWTSILLSKK